VDKGVREKRTEEDLIPPDARAVLRIDLDALRANWRKLNEASGRAECAAVIKADAYDLGIEQICRALTEEGCRTFFVATLDEGRRIRAVQPGAVIYVLDGLLPGAAEYYSGFDLRPALSSLEEIREWAAYCRARDTRLAAAIHIDTGMNRLGLPAKEVDELARNPEVLNDFKVSLIMSHLACADTPASPMNAAQRETFERLTARLPPAPRSLANSGGIFLGPEYHYDLVRPGIVLYGGRAHENRPNPMKTVVRLSAKVLQVFDAEPGTTVGYGATYKIEKPSRLATIACGYADGFLRALSGPTGNPGPVGYIGPHSVRVIGRVSMDLITLDVSDVPRDQVYRGAWVEVMGDRVTLDDLTDRAGTIGYELLSRLGRRVHRIYQGTRS
jgi:alanine racemase